MTATLIQNKTPKICLSATSYYTMLTNFIWIDCLSDRADIDLQIEQFRKDSILGDDSQEVLITCWENFYDLEIDPYHDLDDLLGIAYCVAKHGEAYTHFLELYGFHSEDVYLESFQGHYDYPWQFALDHYEDEYQSWFKADEDYDYDAYADELFTTSHYWQNGYVFKRGCQ